MYGKGVEIDYKTAMQWFQLSAQQRNPEAQVNIGVLYLNGWGVPQNKVEAVAWFIKAADQGNEVAKSHLKALGLKY